MNQRHTLMLAGLATAAGGLVIAALMTTGDNPEAEPGADRTAEPPAETTTPPTTSPSTASSTRTATQKTSPEVDEPPVSLIPRSDKPPRHPVDLGVANEPEAVAKACATAIWSWDTVTDNSPADAAARCAPLATRDAAEQLRQRVAHVDTTWTTWARHDAWASVDVRVHEQYEADVALKLEWVDLTATQHTRGRNGWEAAGADIRMSIGLTRHGKSWRVARVAVW